MKEEALREELERTARRLEEERQKVLAAQVRIIICTCNDAHEHKNKPITSFPILRPATRAILYVLKQPLRPSFAFIVSFTSQQDTE